MNNQVSLKWALPYAVVGIGRDAVYMFVLSFYYLYLTTVLDISPVYIVPIFLIVKFLELIKEPFIGMLIDLCADIFKYNKFRMTILAGGIINAAILIQMFDIPNMNSSVQVIYAIFMYVAWSLSFSMLDIPSWALTSIFGSDHRTREIICGLGRGSAVLGFCLTLVLTYAFFYEDQGLPTHIFSGLYRKVWDGNKSVK
ncbi:MFS transporter [Succinivibrio dextrinosolvens]|uniref:MFS transporter n=1 Tax=Succinivibrio dextrinosolvens TaxID=83771 RepID=UPI0004E0BB1D|nr:MFS transporter [Succinivibrio dextrinosolvens]